MNRQVNSISNGSLILFTQIIFWKMLIHERIDMPVGQYALDTAKMLMTIWKIKGIPRYAHKRQK